MSFSYTKKRAQKRYARKKEKAPSLESFRHLSKVLFVFSMLITISSFWIVYPKYLLLHSSDVLRLVGAFVVLCGYIGLNHAFKKLGKNYSPLFDAYKPFELVKTGVYKYLRHPIYAFNLCVSFGLALSSGIILVLIAAVIGLIFVVRAIYIEEAFLIKEIDGYAEYCKKTWCFIPYIYCL